MPSSRNQSAFPEHPQRAEPLDSVRAALVEQLLLLDQRSCEERTAGGLPLPFIRESLLHLGISLPVRFVHDDVPDDSNSATPIQQFEKNFWLVDSVESGTRGGKGQKRPKVGVNRLYERGEILWECGCPWWRRNRGRDCKHIRQIKTREGIAESPLTTARRRPPTRFVYPEGAWTELTRRAHARVEWSSRVPELLRQLIELVIEEPERVAKKAGTSPGPIGMPRKVTTWALLAKVRENLGYDELRANLAQDSVIQDFGWRKHTPPGTVTLIRKMADQKIVDGLREMVRLTAWMGRFWETEAMIDSEEFPTVAVANSLDMKMDVKRPSYRKRNPVMVVRHHVTGVITMLVAAADITLNSGLGSADGAHLGTLLGRAKKVFPHLRAISGDGAYGSKANFRKCAVERIDAYIHELQNEKRESGKHGWNELAQRMARLERESPQTFREVRRMRNKGEGSGSRWKRSNPHARLRLRVKDAQIAYPPEAWHLLKEELPEGREERKKARSAQGAKLSELPDDILCKVLDAATSAVGLARLAEAWATIVIGNVKMLVMFEHLCGSASTPYRLDIAHDDALPVIPTLKESELRARLFPEIVDGVRGA